MTGTSPWMQPRTSSVRPPAAASRLIKQVNASCTCAQNEVMKLGPSKDVGFTILTCFFGASSIAEAVLLHPGVTGERPGEDAGGWMGVLKAFRAVVSNETMKSWFAAADEDGAAGQRIFKKLSTC